MVNSIAFTLLRKIGNMLYLLPMKKLHPAVTELLAEIEAYRALSGTNRTRFWPRCHARDGNFISQAGGWAAIRAL